MVIADVFSHRFEVSASPIVEDIKLYLDNFHDLKKSEVTVFERQRRYVLGLIMTYIIPALVVSGFCLLGIQECVEYNPCNF